MSKMQQQDTPRAQTFQMEQERNNNSSIIIQEPMLIFLWNIFPLGGGGIYLLIEPDARHSPGQVFN